MSIVCSCLILLASLVWPIVRIQSATIQGEIQAQKAFLDIQNLGQRLLTSTTAVSGNEWQRQSNALWEQDKQLLSFVIRDANNAILYAMPAVSPYYAAGTHPGNSARFELFDAPEKSTSRFSSVLPGGLTVDALFITLSQELVFRALLETLLALLLLALVIATVLLASQKQSCSPEQLATTAPPPPVTEKPSPQLHQHDLNDVPEIIEADKPLPEEDTAALNQEPQPQPESKEPPITSAQPSPEIQIAPETLYEEQPSDRPEAAVTDEATEVMDMTEEPATNKQFSIRFEAATKTPIASDELAIVDPYAAEELLQLSQPIPDATTTLPESAPKGAPEAAPDSEPGTKQASQLDNREGSEIKKRIPVDEHDIGGPKGLYDENSGLCWESYLRDRLGAELQRAASFEQDLVLLLTTWDNVKTDNADYGLFTQTISEFFNFRDLSFAFGSDGVAVVLPNVDVDHAIRQTEELIKKLTFIIQGRTDRLEYLEIFMGLSSRSGRIVDADRMIAEALVALKKARGERDTHIMAFRPDPEKYRSYLTNR